MVISDYHITADAALELLTAIVELATDDIEKPICCVSTAERERVRYDAIQFLDWARQEFAPYAGIPLRRNRMTAAR